MVAKSEFDELVRKEINRAGAGSLRGGDNAQAARDRVARRLNAQEGRSRNSTAYRPSADAPARAPTSSKSRGGGGRKPSGGGGKLPASTSVVPTDKPDQGPLAPPEEQGGSNWSWILPLIIAATGGAYGANKLRNRGKTAAPVEAPPVEPNRVEVPPDPNAVDPARFGTADIPPALSEQEVQDLINRTGVGAPATGEVGARSGGRVIAPGGGEVPTPGWSGSRYGQPIENIDIPRFRYGG